MQGKKRFLLQKYKHSMQYCSDISVHYNAIIKRFRRKYEIVNGKKEFTSIETLDMRIILYKRFAKFLPNCRRYLLKNIMIVENSDYWVDQITLIHLSIKCFANWEKKLIWSTFRVSKVDIYFLQWAKVHTTFTVNKMMANTKQFLGSG